MLINASTNYKMLKLSYDEYTKCNRLGGGNSPSDRIVRLYMYGRSLYVKRQQGLIYRILFRLFEAYYNRVGYTYGIGIPIETEIQGRLVLSHATDIYINPNSKLLGDVFIMQGVTIGGARGKGAPTIGNRVVLSAGSKIIGNVFVGNNVFVGANAVVVKDIPDGVTVAGCPAKIINMHGKSNVDLYLS